MYYGHIFLQQTLEIKKGINIILNNNEKLVLDK